MEAFETMLIEPRKFTDVGTRLVVPVRLGGLARHTGIEVDFEAVHVWTFNDEKVSGEGQPRGTGSRSRTSIMEAKEQP